MWIRAMTTTTCGDGSVDASYAAASPGEASSPRSGSAASDWVVERTVSGWPAADASTAATNAPEHFLAFVGIAATLICHRRLAKKRTLNPTKTATRGAA